MNLGEDLEGELSCKRRLPWSACVKRWDEKKVCSQAWADLCLDAVLFPRWLCSLIQHPFVRPPIPPCWRRFCERSRWREGMNEEREEGCGEKDCDVVSNPHNAQTGTVEVSRHKDESATPDQKLCMQDPFSGQQELCRGSLRRYSRMITVGS
jgi:hypothetical protein